MAACCAEVEGTDSKSVTATAMGSPAIISQLRGESLGPLLQGGQLSHLAIHCNSLLRMLVPWQKVLCGDTSWL